MTLQENVVIVVYKEITSSNDFRDPGRFVTCNDLPERSICLAVVSHSHNEIPDSQEQRVDAEITCDGQAYQFQVPATVLHRIFLQYTVFWRLNDRKVA